MIKAGGIAKPDRIGGGEKPEAGVGMDHPVGVKKGELAVDLEDALDDEHNIGAAGVIFVEHDGHRVLQCPGKDALAEFGHLLAVTKDDGVLADEVDAADMAVEIDPDTGPVQACRDLLDMGRLTGAVITLDHHPPVVTEPGQNRQRGVMVELVGVVNGRHIFRSLRKGRHGHVHIKAKGLAHINRGVGRRQRMGAHLGHCLVVGHEFSSPRAAAPTAFCQDMVGVALLCNDLRIKS